MRYSNVVPNGVDKMNEIVFRALPSKRGGDRGAQIARRERVGGIESPVIAESEPRLGAHIVTRRHGYAHHGIYVGACKVVHYAGLSRGLRRGPIEEISTSSFAAGYPVGVVSSVPPRFGEPEVVRRARSRVGEDSYWLLTNNCEHFCEWCLRGQHRSYRIDTCLSFPSRALEHQESEVHRPAQDDRPFPQRDRH
jgi:hypothetical protein